MKALISILLAFFYLFPQVAMSYSCPFGLADKDQGLSKLVSEATSFIEDIKKQKDACAFPESEISNFATSLDIYKSSMGIQGIEWDGVANLYGSGSDFSITCRNYQSYYDSQADLYRRNRSLGRDTDGQSDFESNCNDIPATDKAALDNCIELERSELVDEKEIQCKGIMSEDKWRAKEKAEIAFAQNANNLITNYLEKTKDPKCKSEAGDEFFNGATKSALGLTAQIATIAAIPSGGAILFPMVTGLLDGLIGYMSDNPNFLSQIEAEKNFNKMACLYKDLERKSFGCENFEADNFLNKNKVKFEQSLACKNKVLPVIDKLYEFSKLVDFLSGKDEKGSGLNKEDASYALMDVLAADKSKLRDNLLTAFKASVDDPDVIEKLKLAEPGVGRGELKKRRNRFISSKKNFKNLLDVIDHLNRLDSTPASVEKIIKEKFKDKSVLETIRNAFKYAGKIEGSPLSLLQSYEDNAAFIQKYDGILKTMEKSNARELDLVFNGVFSFFNKDISPQLSKLKDSIRNIKNSQTASSKDRKEKYNRIIKPLYDACSLLESSTRLEGGSQKFASSQVGSTVDTYYKDSCRIFNCKDGSGLQLYDVRKNKDPQYFPSLCESGDKQCIEEEYKERSCKNDNLYEIKSAKLKNEFYNSGTICGKPIINQ